MLSQGHIHCFCVPECVSFLLLFCVLVPTHTHPVHLRAFAPRSHGFTWIGTLDSDLVWIFILVWFSSAEDHLVDLQDLNSDLLPCTPSTVCVASASDRTCLRSKAMIIDSIDQS